jgi:hypothetical protein
MGWPSIEKESNKELPMNTFKQLSNRMSKILLGIGLATAFLSLNTACNERDAREMVHGITSGSARAIDVQRFHVSAAEPALDVTDDGVPASLYTEFDRLEEKKMSLTTLDQ